MRVFASKVIAFVAREGVWRSLRRSVVFIGRMLGDGFSGVLCVVCGDERAFRLLLRLFDFRCRHGLFVGEKRLWLNRRLMRGQLPTVWVDPGQVGHQLKGGVVPYIESGDWDLAKIEFTLHDFVREHFQENIPVEQTRQYAAMEEAIRNRQWHKAYGCRTVADLRRHMDLLVAACKDIREGGYRAQADLPEGRRSVRSEASYPNEVLVSVDRDGRYLHESGGSHRLSMAKVCGLGRIPVVIIRMHYDHYRREGGPDHGSSGR